MRGCPRTLNIGFEIDALPSKRPYDNEHKRVCLRAVVCTQQPAVGSGSIVRVRQACACRNHRQCRDARPTGLGVNESRRRLK